MPGPGAAGWPAVSLLEHSSVSWPVGNGRRRFAGGGWDSDGAGCLVASDLRPDERPAPSLKPYDQLLSKTSGTDTEPVSEETL